MRASCLQRTTERKHLKIMEVASAAILLFLIMDPLGNIPVFLSLLKALPAPRRLVVLARELVIALAVLLLFLYSG